MQVTEIWHNKNPRLGRQALSLCLPMNAVHIWQIGLEVEDSPLKPFWKLLDEAERQRALDLRKVNDQKRFICTHGLLRLILSWYLDENPCSIGFSFNQFGKPRLESVVNLEFNLAHSSNLVLFAFTSSSQIGVDVERVIELEDFDALGNWFLSNNEKELLSSSRSVAKVENFYKLWTIKEAYLKMLGRGLADNLDNYNMVPALNGQQKDWSAKVFSPLSGYLAALAASGDVGQIVKIEGLSNHFPC
jgi:4'-phosphopantetheinyl transferase